MSLNQTQPKHLIEVHAREASGQENVSTEQSASAELTLALMRPPGPKPHCSLAQPVVLGGEAPPAVPLVEHHQPPVDRVEQLQGLTFGGLCGRKPG